MIYIVIMLPITIIPMTLGRIVLSSADIIKGCFYIEGRILYNDPVWFLFCMFQVLMIQKLIHLPKLKLGWRVLVTCAAFVGGYILQRLEFHYLGIDKCLVALGFYTAGSIYEIIIKSGKIREDLSRAYLFTNCIHFPSI